MTAIKTFTVVVPAAGIGKRMQADCPKQYLRIGEKTLLEHTLSNLLEHPNIAKVVVILHPDDDMFASLAISACERISTVIGGEERSDSVLAGLEAVDGNENWVLVHDAARPCLHPDDLSKLVSLADEGNIGGILACPVRDTMKRSNDAQEILKTESRDKLWHALTPQFFQLAELKNALKLAKAKHIAITDEASAIEYLGGQVKIVEGRSSNIKVTQAEDLLLATFYLSQLDTSVKG